MEKTINRAEYFSVFIKFKNIVKLNNKLMADLEQHPYFRDEMQKVVMQLESECEKLVFILVEFTRSRSTCDELIRLLRESGQTVAADQLVKHNTSKGHQMQSFNDSGPEFTNPQIPFQASKSPMTGTLYYTMNQKPRGKCYIINNVSKDVFMESKRFQFIFERMHFQVNVCHNWTAQQMATNLKVIAKEADNFSPQAFVVMIITHGLEERVLGYEACEALRVLEFNPNHTEAKQVVKSDVMDIKEIVDTFSDENCRKLSKCPKLFFFTCCRNSLETSEPTAEGRTLARPFVTETTAHTDRTNLPVMQSLDQRWVDSNQDTFICYSCAEGRKTFYDEDYGITYFGQALSHSMAQYACEESLSSILSRTCDLLQFFIKHTGFNPPEFRGKGLRRQLCFNP